MGKKYTLILPDVVLSEVKKTPESGKFLALDIKEDGNDIAVGFVNKASDAKKYDRDEVNRLFLVIHKADLGEDFDRIKCHVRICEIGDYFALDTKHLLKKYYPDIYRTMQGIQTSIKKQKKRTEKMKRKGIEDKKKIEEKLEKDS